MNTHIIIVEEVIDAPTAYKMRRKPHRLVLGPCSETVARAWAERYNKRRRFSGANSAVARVEPWRPGAA